MTNKAPWLGQVNVDSFFPDLSQADFGRAELDMSAVLGAMNGRGFLAELKRRNVYKVVIAYAAVGWLLIQVATQVFPFFEVPGWAVRLVVLFVIVGFPIALLLRRALRPPLPVAWIGEILK